MTEDTIGFEVTEEIAVGDLTAVQEERLPVCQNLKVRIAKAGVKASKNGDLKTLKLDLVIVDGIPAVDPDTGETKMRYANKHVFPSFNDLLVWANPETKTSNWYTSKQYLLPFKQFLVAMGVDFKDVKINDAFLESLVGREVLVSIKHEQETVQNEAGEYVPTGGVRERVVNFRKAA